MSLNIDLYKQRLDAYKVSGKDGKVDSIKKSIIDNFYNNPSYFSVLVNDVERDVHIVTDNNKQFKVLCKPNETIGTGNYVVWNDKTFLCTSVNENDSVQSKGILQKTNHTLNWINSTNTLITKPCIVSAKTLYTTGVKEEKQIVVPDGMVGIQLPYDEDTGKLSRNDMFIFNNTKYKITFYNKVEFPGLLLLICEEEIPSITTLDDMENEIANRYTFDGAGNKIDRLSQTEPIPPDDEEPDNPPTEDKLTIQIIGQDSIMVMSEGTYTAKVFNNGAEVVDKLVAFSVSPTSLASIKSQGDNKCVVKANTNFNVGEVMLKATLADDEGVFVDKKIIITGF